MNKSIATGAPLSKETFDDFVVRLRHDCVGDGVKRHYTADAFIKRKKHDYDELRVYVDSQYWCWEFNAIKNAILSGKLKYVE